MKKLFTKVSPGHLLSMAMIVAVGASCMTTKPLTREERAPTSQGPQERGAPPRESLAPEVPDQEAGERIAVGEISFSSGERAIARGVLLSTKGLVLAIAERDRILLVTDDATMLQRINGHIGEVIEIVGTWEPPRVTDQGTIDRMREEAARVQGQGADLWHATSWHLRMDSFEVVADADPEGYRGSISRLH